MASERDDSGKVVLEQGQVWAGRIQVRERLEVTCRTGRLWVTLEGDAADYILAPGEEFWADRPGLVVAEALACPAGV
jgi:hypothetical protein